MTDTDECPKHNDRAAKTFMDKLRLTPWEHQLRAREQFMLEMLESCPVCAVLRAKKITEAQMRPPSPIVAHVDERGQLEIVGPWEEKSDAADS